MHLSEHEIKGTFAKPRFHEAGAPDDKVHMTPAMLRAGVNALTRYDSEFETREEGVERIFRAMCLAFKNTSQSG
jgi:hypothetical protein